MTFRLIEIFTLFWTFFKKIFYTGSLVAGTTTCATNACGMADAPTCCVENPCDGSCPHKCKASAAPQKSVTDANCKECNTGLGNWPCDTAINCVCADFVAPPIAKCNSLTSASTPSLADVCGPSSAYTGALVGTGTADCAGETCTYTDRTTCCAQKPCTGSCAYKCTVASDQRLSGGTQPEGTVDDAKCKECKTVGSSSWPCTPTGSTTNCVCAVAEPCTSSCSGSCGAHPYLYPHPRSTCNDAGVTNDKCNACKASQLWPCNSPGCCVCWG